MKRHSLVATATISFAILALVSGPFALGQSGSTGGVIGKRDKAASGIANQPISGRTNMRPRKVGASHSKAPSKRRARKPAEATAPQARSCGNIVGRWSWPHGSVMAFYKNGGAGTAGKPPGGTWRCSGSAVVAVFDNGGRDRYVVAPDGNSLSFTTNWIPGTYTATRQR